MTDDQVVIPPWGGAILKGTDFSVGTTDADVEHAQHDLVRLGDPGSFVLDDFDFPGSWKNRDCLHIIFFRSTPAPGSRVRRQRVPGGAPLFSILRSAPHKLLRSV